ncbi:MAG: T9SS type A sorting domain-containing protein [Chitinophagales bacterium]|nr:T9SS type A sorting domain-containing protein [Chitinophagales bacterium]
MTEQFNREQLAAGIYFLQIKMNEETSIMKIVIE